MNITDEFTYARAVYHARELSRIENVTWDIVRFEALALTYACRRSDRDYRAPPGSRVLATYRHGRVTGYDE